MRMIYLESVWDGVLVRMIYLESVWEEGVCEDGLPGACVGGGC